MTNNNLTYDELCQDQLEVLNRKYDELQAKFNMLERRANISKEDAKLARLVVVEYANALTISKEQHKKMINEIEAAINAEQALGFTRISRIKETLREHKRIASVDHLTKLKLNDMKVNLNRKIL